MKYVQTTEYNRMLIMYMRGKYNFYLSILFHVFRELRDDYAVFLFKIIVLYVSCHCPEGNNSNNELVFGCLKIKYMNMLRNSAITIDSWTFATDIYLCRRVGPQQLNPLQSSIRKLHYPILQLISQNTMVSPSILCNFLCLFIMLQMLATNLRVLILSRHHYLLTISTCKEYLFIRHWSLCIHQLYNANKKNAALACLVLAVAKLPESIAYYIQQ